MSDIYKIAIIGAGNLGSRHLQALALTKQPIDITVVDPAEESLRIAQNRWEEMGSNSMVKECRFTNDIKNLPLELEVVVVATSSGPRRAVIENLLAVSKVKYLILEKVLFQKIDDYEAVGMLLAEKSVPAWVNCGRRIACFYKELRDILRTEAQVSMSVAGGNWGMGCNSIHMLDIYAYLTMQDEFSGNISLLDAGTIDSKRNGYIEFTGELRIDSPKGILSLISYKNSVRPITITIDSENYHIDIDERNQFARILKYDGKEWLWNEKEMDIKRQSEITHELIQELLATGTCGLATYEESTKLHKVLLNGFLAHLSKGKKERCKICPIT